MSTIKTTHIDGDVTVGRNAAMGGDVLAQGDAHVKGNLKVDGWLDAPNVKQPCMGLFATEETLKAAYPRPRNGWWALVGDTLPAAVYRAWHGEWAATGETGGEPNLALNSLQTAIDNLHDDIDSLQEGLGTLQEGLGTLQEDMAGLQDMGAVVRFDKVDGGDVGEYFKPVERPTAGQEQYVAWLEKARRFAVMDRGVYYGEWNDFDTADGGERRKGWETYTDPTTLLPYPDKIYLCNADAYVWTAAGLVKLTAELLDKISQMGAVVVEADLSQGGWNFPTEDYAKLQSAINDHRPVIVRDTEAAPAFTDFTVVAFDIANTAGLGLLLAGARQVGYAVGGTFLRLTVRAMQESPTGYRASVEAVADGPLLLVMHSDGGYYFTGSTYGDVRAAVNDGRTIVISDGVRYFTVSSALDTGSSIRLIAADPYTPLLQVTFAMSATQLDDGKIAVNVTANAAAPASEVEALSAAVEELRGLIDEGTGGIVPDIDITLETVAI